MFEFRFGVCICAGDDVVPLERLAECPCRGGEVAVAVVVAGVVTERGNGVETGEDGLIVLRLEVWGEQALACIVYIR